MKANLGILTKISISISRHPKADLLEFATMTKTKPSWAKPELVSLGKIGNVAGSKTVGGDGGSAQPKS